MTCILLTGSSRGIGAAAKAALEARGATVVGQATTSSATDTVPADFTEPFAPHELWQAALARAGGEIDVLVNNAGLFPIRSTRPTFTGSRRSRTPCGSI